MGDRRVDQIADDAEEQMRHAERKQEKETVNVKRSASYATVANALQRSDYNELTRERLGQIEDAQAERRQKEQQW